MDSEEPKPTSVELVESALKLARIRAWHRLEGPPNRGGYPYSLTLKNVETGRLASSGVLTEGEIYELILVADEDRLTAPIRSRYLYVFSIDAWGKRTLLFPRLSRGNADNRLPVENGSFERPPTEIVVGPRLIIAPPFGTDSIFLLTSSIAIPDLGVFEEQGVRRIDGVRTVRAEQSPLARLLNGYALGVRSGSLVSPMNWSIENILIRTRTAVSHSATD